MSREHSPEFPERAPAPTPPVVIIPTREQRALGIHLRTEHPFGYRPGSSADLQSGRVTRSHANPTSFGPRDTVAANAADCQPSTSAAEERQAVVRGNARRGSFTATPEQTYWRNAQPSSSSSNSSTPPAKINLRIRLVGEVHFSETSDSEGEAAAKPLPRPIRPGFARRTGVPERPVVRSRNPVLNAVGIGREDTDTEPSSVDTVIQKFPDLAVAKQRDDAVITAAYHSSVAKDDLEKQHADAAADREKAVESVLENETGSAEDSGAEADGEKSDVEDTIDANTSGTTGTSDTSDTSMETRAEWERLQRAHAQRKVRFNLIGSMKRKFEEMEAEDGNEHQPTTSALSLYQPETAVVNVVKPVKLTDDEHEPGTETENELMEFEESLIHWSDDEKAPIPDLEYPPVIPKPSAAEIAMDEADIADLVAIVDAAQPDNDELPDFDMEELEKLETEQHDDNADGSIQQPIAAAVQQELVAVEAVHVSASVPVEVVLVQPAAVDIAPQAEEPHSAELEVGQPTPAPSSIVDNKGMFPLNPFVPSIFIKV
ncbi:nucleolar protein dao-5-like [Paramacrobiotus metropolitanus]|uniref:nucleolar protein dao-5-like n=1 Tax=Paramacrobiotus metropolitanus TaxID=2943436 RepID=UPI0024459BC9|nr:nucleolar protein dao-5-like [Paramacrobiotus metropolitanus]